MCVLLVATMLLASAQPEVESVGVLVVDETRTFASTMRVGGLVNALKRFGVFDVDVHLADVGSSWDDPLVTWEQGRDSGAYDIVLIVPVGLDDGSVDWVWVVSDGPTFLSDEVLAGVELIGQIVGTVFEGSARPVGVYDDLMPSFLYGEYLLEGWIR